MTDISNRFQKPLAMRLQYVHVYILLSMKGGISKEAVGHLLVVASIPLPFFFG